MATTIEIHGSSNDTNLVLASDSASIADRGSASVVPNVADSVLAGRMFSYSGSNLLFSFLSATQMIRLRIHPDVSYNASDLTNRTWWLNDDNVITDFVYEFDSAVLDASQNVHLKGSSVSLTKISSESEVYSVFQWKNTIISSSTLTVPVGDMILDTETPTYDVVLQEITNEVALADNVSDVALAGRMFLGARLEIAFLFTSSTQMIRLSANPDVSFVSPEYEYKSWWLNHSNSLLNFVYNFDTCSYDASQNINLTGSENTVTGVYSTFEWKNTIIDTSNLTIPQNDMLLDGEVPPYNSVGALSLPEIY